jgi:hypothetical protein
MRPVHRTVARFVSGITLLAAALMLAPRAAHAQVSVGGVVYAQYQYQMASDSLAADSNIQHVNNFDITRAYINVVGRFAGGIYTRITADIFTNAGIGGSRGYRLKYAYVAWTPEGSALTYKIGQIHTPLLDWEEALWDFRMQGQMPMERGGYVSSSDFGFGVDGKFAADQFNFNAGIYNGETYNGALADQHKDLMARASYRVLATNDGSRVGGLRLTAYAQYGAPTSGGERQRYMGMVSYRTMDLTLAAEFAATKDSTTGGAGTTGGVGNAAAVAERSGQVISAFGVFHFPQTRVSLIGRVDLIDPNTASASAGDKTTRVIGGVAYQLTPNLRLLADVDALSFESGFVPTAGNYATYINRTTAYIQAMFTF